MELRTRRPDAVGKLVARVISVLPDDRRGWSVGCQLARRLTPEELRELL